VYYTGGTGGLLQQQTQQQMVAGHLWLVYTNQAS
jgi:hypothetical protein